MSKELSKGQKILFLVAVMLSNIAVMGDTVIYPIVHNLYQDFPTQTSAVNYILSGPPLLIVFSSIFAPLLLKKMSKKTLLVLGGVLFTLGAVFGVAFNSALWMVFTRSLVGIGQGFVNVTAVALISEVYVEENIVAKFIGYYNASMNIVGMIFAYFAGTFALARWQDSFTLYYSAIPMLIMIIFFVPNLKSKGESGEVEQVQEIGGKKESMGFEFWQLIVTFFIFATCAMIIGYFTSVYVAENNLGDASLTGSASSVAQIASFLFAMCFGFIYTKIKKGTLILGYFIGISTFVLMYLFPSQLMVYIGNVLNSVAYVLVLSYAYARGTAAVPESRINSAVAIVTATYGIGSFVSTYFATWLMGVFNTTEVTPILIVPIIVCAALTVFEAVYVLKQKKDEPMRTES